MPTIAGIPGPHRFYFYSFDCDEPPHVHVQCGRGHCKIWLDGIVVAAASHVPAREIARIRRTIFQHRLRMQEAWREHCSQAR